MKQFIIGVSHLWDVQKQRCANEMEGVYVINKPPMWMAKVKGVLGRDGIHPTEIGYRHWGNHIASELLPKLRDSHGRRLWRPRLLLIDTDDDWLDDLPSPTRVSGLFKSPQSSQDSQFSKLSATDEDEVRQAS